MLGERFLDAGVLKFSTSYTCTCGETIVVTPHLSSLPVFGIAGAATWAFTHDKSNTYK